jgi:flavin reductase (DIM6/NTAB) family NADH-FMN oxidoreductase RutF
MADFPATYFCFRMTIDPQTISIPQLQGYLQSAVAPRPIALASTIDTDGHINLSPFSFFNIFSANPPVMVFSPSRRVTNNTTKHTLENILENPEVVINIVNFPMVEQVSLASTEYEKGVDEFLKSGLTAIPSTKIKPPRVAESPVSFECVVDQVIPLGTGAGAGNLVLARVVLIHIREEYLNATGQLDTTKLDLVARMGASWYSRATVESLFEIPKPLTTKGIGVDQLPLHVRHSTVLTGNNLGRLGNVEHIPDAAAIAAAAAAPAVQSALQLPEPEKTIQIHQIARELLEKGETATALATVFI